jgi:hypothetical protein
MLGGWEAGRWFVWPSLIGLHPRPKGIAERDGYKSEVKVKVKIKMTLRVTN